jgi:hypothetical protein
VVLTRRLLQKGPGRTYDALTAVDVSKHFDFTVHTLYGQRFPRFAARDLGWRGGGGHGGHGGGGHGGHGGGGHAGHAGHGGGGHGGGGGGGSLADQR